MGSKGGIAIAVPVVRVVLQLVVGVRRLGRQPEKEKAAAGVALAESVHIVHKATIRPVGAHEQDLHPRGPRERPRKILGGPQPHDVDLVDAKLRDFVVVGGRATHAGRGLKLCALLVEQLGGHLAVEQHAFKVERGNENGRLRLENNGLVRNAVDFVRRRVNDQPSVRRQLLEPFRRRRRARRNAVAWSCVPSCTRISGAIIVRAASRPVGARAFF